VADPLLDVAVDALDEISAGAFVGSLLAVLVLVAIPVLLLGTVSPWAIRLAVHSVEEAGTVAGRLYALSTAGSLLGTLISALVLIPLVGTRRTFLIFALAIAIVAVWGLRPVRRWALAPAAIAALIALPVGTLKADTDGGGRVIHEAETEYQYARVIEYPDRSRTLELNEGQAEHSVCEAECDAGRGGPRDPSSVLTGNVWDGHLVLQFAGREEAPRRVAILGNAAGTTSRAYEEFFPRTRVDGVEIDAELSDIGREYFDMNNPRLHLYHEDARPFLRRIDARYDVISVDAYRQPYIPFYLTTVEFFETVRDRLTPGGVLIVNVGHPEGQDDLEKVLTATIGEVFPHVMRDPIEDTNTLLLGSEAPLSSSRLLAAVPDLPHALKPTALAATRRLAPPLDGDEVYTDDRAPVEWLIDKSIVDYASGE
jgi:spermidine synthase